MPCATRRSLLLQDQLIGKQGELVEATNELLSDDRGLVQSFVVVNETASEPGNFAIAPDLDADMSCSSTVMSCSSKVPRLGAEECPVDGCKQSQVVQLDHLSSEKR